MMNLDKKLLKKIEREKKKREKIAAIGKRGVEPNLKAISDALDEYYFLEKLKTYCAYLNYSNIMDPSTIPYKASGFSLINEIVLWVETNPITNPVIIFFNEIRKLYENAETPGDTQLKNFDALLKLIKNYIGNLSTDDGEELLSLLVNFCIRNMNENKKGFLSRHFLTTNELLNFRHKDNPTSNIQLPASVFKNMIVTAFIIKDKLNFSDIKTVGLTSDSRSGFANVYEWVEKFIEFYGKKIDKKAFRSHYPYCYALLEFNRGNLLKAYRMLYDYQTGVRGVFMSMNIKILFLKIIFEINLEKPIVLENDDIEIEKVLEALRGLIRDNISRKKQLSYQLRFYSDFAVLYRKLYRLYNKYPFVNKKDINQFKREKNQLLAEIDKTGYSYKSWFIEKLMSIK